MLEKIDLKSWLTDWGGHETKKAFIGNKIHENIFYIIKAENVLLSARNKGLIPNLHSSNKTKVVYFSPY